MVQEKMLGYKYDAGALSDLLKNIIDSHSSDKSRLWLTAQISRWQSQHQLSQFYSTFTAVTRFADKKNSIINQEEEKLMATIRHNFFMKDWPLERIIRCWWLLQLPTDNSEVYVHIIETLFLSADMHELVTLYSALPLLAFPENFIHRTQEGIRTNISLVLGAIALHNPYPSAYLPEDAWNQLILKCFFTDKPVEQIVGLEERANPHLSAMLCDYARERWAAGRPVNPQLWRLIGKFIHEDNFPLIEKLFLQKSLIEQQAAALCCAASDFTPAKKLLEQHKEFKQEIASGQLTWNTIILSNN